MFVSCGNCNAEYELDDAKIPAGGARLRCTNCSHSFVVTPPEVSDLQSADDLAHDALSAKRGSAADAEPRSDSEPVGSFDFYGEAEADPEFEAALEAASEQGFARDDASEPDPAFEAAMDQGFDIDTGAADDEEEIAYEDELNLDRAADPDPEVEAAPEEGFELDAAADPEPEVGVADPDELNLDCVVDPDSDFEALSDEGFELDAETEAASDFEAASEDGFDLGGDLDADSELESASHADLPADVEADSDSDGEADWQFNEEIVSAEPEARRGAREPALEKTDSAFGEDDDWSDLSSAEEVVDDLLGSGEPIEADAAAAVDELLGGIDGVASPPRASRVDATAAAKRPSAALDLGDAHAVDAAGADPAADAGDAFADLADWGMFDQPAEGGGSGGRRGRSASITRDGARAEPKVGIAVEMAGDARAGTRWTDRVAAAAGWVAVCVMLIVSLVGGLASHSRDARATLGSWSGAGFEADQITGRWVDNAVAGSIYVVSGRVRRASGADRAARNTLGLRLIDAKGRSIDRAPIPLAPSVPERILREARPAEIDAFQARRAGRIAAVGERWVAFEAVVTELPRFASRFELEAIEP